MGSFTRPLTVTPKYVICNADEGEPGTIKDRYIMEGDPHKVLEGIAIAGFAVGASRGFIYVRGEYYLSKARLNQAIEQARAKGFLGEKLFGTEFSSSTSRCAPASAATSAARKPRSSSPSKGIGLPPLQAALPQEGRWLREAYDLLERFNIRQYAHTAARHLPYGEQRRLEMARALISGPQLLLLDEPAAGMNEAEVDGLIHLIREIKKEFSLTILLIEHQMQVVMHLCQRIIVLDYGRKIAEGTPDAIRRDPAVLEAYLGHK